MDIQPENYWFVGAVWGNEEQTERFIAEGIWQNGYEDKYQSLVASMLPGERIAIKAAYTKKYNLPFKSNGQTASVM